MRKAWVVLLLALACSREVPVFVPTQTDWERYWKDKLVGNSLVVSRQARTERVEMGVYLSPEERYLWWEHNLSSGKCYWEGGVYTLILPGPQSVQIVFIPEEVAPGYERNLGLRWSMWLYPVDENEVLAQEGRFYERMRIEEGRKVPDLEVFRGK